MTWTSKKNMLSNDILKFQIYENDRAINYRDWIRLMQNSEAFSTFYTETLKACDFKGFFWEVKPINKNELDFDFEFVLVDGRQLNHLTANNARFEKHFTAHETVVSFPNLRGDALLVVPTPISELSNYTHLAQFLRHAPEQQIVFFWKTVANVYNQQLGENKTWLSTAGLGVHWLHVRIDTRPKYYRYKNYK